MLYKLTKNHDQVTAIEPMAFSALPLEKDLEDLIATSLLDVLFEGNELMPIRQERAMRPEADIYALDRQGDLIIFELKRDIAGGGAVHQALRYCETAAHWTYQHLQNMLTTYLSKPADLQKEHQLNFELERPLDQSAFNVCQRLVIVGNACDEELIRNVSYWKSKGLLLDFIPYRRYSIGNDQYFEFFSLPYDQHANPDHAKGVIFDTNLSYDEEAIWYMCDQGRVAAFGGQMHIVHRLAKNDIVFLYHSHQGIIAAGRVTSNKVREDDPNEALYLPLEWLTPVPKKGQPYQFMPPSQVNEILGHGFFWACTIKTPYLSIEESQKLLEPLRALFSTAT